MNCWMAALGWGTLRPGFPIWSWYPAPQNRRRALIFLGSDARNPAPEGDTLWVTKNPSPFSSPSADPGVAGADRLTVDSGGDHGRRTGATREGCPQDVGAG